VTVHAFDICAPLLRRRTSYGLLPPGAEGGVAAVAM
jgi:hypothetical protein